nr:aldose reductase-related protein 2-like [Anas platyrhynchos]
MHQALYRVFLASLNISGQERGGGCVGRVKAIRISSFNCRQTDRLLSKPDLNHKPANNQVLIWLHIQRNVNVIPKPVTPHHTEENVKVLDCELAKEEMETFLTFKK